MSREDRAGWVLDRISLASPQQRGLHLVALLTGVLPLVLVPAAGGVFHPVFTTVGVLVAVLAALAPASNAPLGLVVLLGSLWALSVPRGVDAWTLAVAVDLCVLHLACTLASYGPPGLVLDRALLALWRGRLVLCLGAAVLVWAASRVVGFLDLPESGLLVGLALLALLGWLVLLFGRLVSRAD
jgi:hypothetical protein